MAAHILTYRVTVRSHSDAMRPMCDDGYESTTSIRNRSIMPRAYRLMPRRIDTVHSVVSAVTASEVHMIACQLLYAILVFGAYGGLLAIASACTMSVKTKVHTSLAVTSGMHEPTPYSN